MRKIPSEHSPLNSQDFYAVWRLFRKGLGESGGAVADRRKAKNAPYKYINKSPRNEDLGFKCSVQLQDTEYDENKWNLARSVRRGYQRLQCIQALHRLRWPLT